MAYVGNVPAVAYTNTVKDTFSGDGSTVAFTLSLPTTTNNVRVVVENVIQDPTVAYGVSGTTLTFTSAPPSGTNNVYVVHLGPAVQTVQPPTQLSGNFTLTGDLTQTGDLTVTGALAATTLSGDGSALTGVGKVLQVVSFQTGAVATGTTTMALDDTIPHLSAAITPISASSKLIITVSLQLDKNNANTYMAALFQDANSNAIAGQFNGAFAAGSSLPMAFTHSMTAGTTSSTTFTVRAGSDGAGTVTLNGRGGGRIFGGVSVSSIVILEVAA
jgi:hypothetical protein